jgi:hypothetical protein
VRVVRTADEPKSLDMSTQQVLAAVRAISVKGPGLRRLVMVCVALIFLVGVTATLVQARMAQSDMGIRGDVAGGSPGPQPPCTGQMPGCVDHVGCVTVSALPTFPGSVVVVFEWISLDYDLVPESLSGISVKPELSPPILAA